MQPRHVAFFGELNAVEFAFGVPLGENRAESSPDKGGASGNDFIFHRNQKVSIYSKFCVTDKLQNEWAHLNDSVSPFAAVNF